METSSVKTGTFSRDEKIKKSSDIRILFKKGKKVSTNGAKLFFLPNALKINRIAFTFPTGYGNAVERNYSKRLSRESYRFVKKNLKVGYDMVLLIYKGHDFFHTRCNQICFLSQKAGLYK
ncbi:MAG: ribonuclease P protein component [Spirochaetales bacterium]